MRRERAGAWQPGDTRYLPARPVHLEPGEDRMLEVLVGGRCRAGGALDVRIATTTGTSTVRVDAAGGARRC